MAKAQNKEEQSLPGEGDIKHKSRLTFVKNMRMETHRYANSKYKTKVLIDLYRCTCGTEKEIRRAHVKRGTILSCGCLNKELSSARYEKNIAKYRNVGGNEGNKYGGGGRKGQKPHNKGKIFLKGIGYVTPQRADAIYWGLKGEVWNLRERFAPNKGKKFIDGEYV